MSVDWVEVAAIATCVGVLVNAGVVVVALLPIHIAKKQREARGLLAAANLRSPMVLAHKTMLVACDHLQVYAQPKFAESPKLLESVDMLRKVPDWMRAYLAKFDITDAAYLEGDHGPRLAQATGMIEAAVDALALSVKRFDSVMRDWDKSVAGSVSPTSTLKLNAAFGKARLEVIKEADFLPELFRFATDGLGDFVDYCKHLFQPTPQKLPLWKRLLRRFSSRSA